METGSRIFVAGSLGLVGSAVVRRLRAEGHQNLLLAERDTLDLTDSRAVDTWFERERPEYVVMAAAKVGGILANSTYPVDFLETNLRIEINVTSACHRFGVRKYLFLGSSCIYPKFAPQPIPEDALLTGSLEPTNEWYAIAKIAGIKLAQAYRRQYGSHFISAMPTNMYGPNDNFDLQSSHVLPAMIRRFHEAKESGAAEVVLWGTGAPRREFLYVDDCAAALVHLLRHYDGDEHINVGTGEDLTIRELAELVRETVGFKGAIAWDSSKPDGTPRKMMDVTRLKASGWAPEVPLPEGIRRTYAWYLERLAGRA